MVLEYRAVDVDPPIETLRLECRDGKFLSSAYGAITIPTAIKLAKESNDLPLERREFVLRITDR